MFNINDLFEQISRLNVLVVGDVMLDRYLNGRVGRISPEAPVPVVDHVSEEDRLGGAANVALNIRALGSNPILCGVVGNDPDSTSFFQLLSELQLSDSGILASTERTTTVKTRIIADTQHLLRLDKENIHDLSGEESSKFLSILERIFSSQKIDAIILQDYNKGVLSPKVIQWILRHSKENHIPVAVDPKFRNFWAYQSVELFKPNLKEVRDALKLEISTDQQSLEDAANELHKRLGNQCTLITLSEKGVFFDVEGKSCIVPTQARNVADVCGAGDAVISVAALGLAIGLEAKEIAMLANLAGGQVVEKLGVVPVDREQLRKELLRESIAF